MVKRKMNNQEIEDLFGKANQKMELLIEATFKLLAKDEMKDLPYVVLGSAVNILKAMEFSNEEILEHTRIWLNQFKDKNHD